jgi:hypothetical protein
MGGGLDAGRIARRVEHDALGLREGVVAASELDLGKASRSGFGFRLASGAFAGAATSRFLGCGHKE